MWMTTLLILAMFSIQMHLQLTEPGHHAEEESSSSSGASQTVPACKPLSVRRLDTENMLPGECQ